MARIEWDPEEELRNYHLKITENSWEDIKALEKAKKAKWETLKWDFMHV